MDIDPIELAHTAENASRSKKLAWLNPSVAVAIALLATFMGICKVKDDNIVQGMQQAQADKIDHWSYYQARNVREEIAKSTLVQLRLQAADIPPERQADYAAAIAQYEALAKDQNSKKEVLRLQAIKDQETYDALNFRDDQFDLSDAAIAIAISMLAITSLTQLWWLFGLSMFPSVMGVVMGLAGLMGWGFHPTFIIKLLS